MNNTIRGNVGSFSKPHIFGTYPVLAICLGMALIVLPGCDGEAKRQLEDSKKRVAELEAELAKVQAELSKVKSNVDAESHRRACLKILASIDGAVQVWSLEKRKPGTAVPTMEDIAEYLAPGLNLKCPDGGHYTLGTVKDGPKCSFEGHTFD